MAASRSTCCGGARIRTGGQDSLILQAAKAFLLLAMGFFFRRRLIHFMTIVNPRFPPGPPPPALFHRKTQPPKVEPNWIPPYYLTTLEKKLFSLLSLCT